MNKVLEKIRKFRDERDWMQFHDPKNLAVSIMIEAAELLEHFQWKNEKAVTEHIRKNREEIADELADVAIYLAELADNLGIDLLQAMDRKLEKDAKNCWQENACRWISSPNSNNSIWMTTVPATGTTSAARSQTNTTKPPALRRMLR